MASATVASDATKAQFSSLKTKTEGELESEALAILVDSIGRSPVWLLEIDCLIDGVLDSNGE